MFSVVDIAEAVAALAAGDPERARAPAAAALGPGAPLPAAWGNWIEGLARWLLGERAVALACLRRAADRLEALGMPFQAARARLEWAAVTVVESAPGDGDRGAAARRGLGEEGRAAAVEAAQDSLAVFDRLGARPPADRARWLLRELGERPVAQRRTGTKPDRRLSDRELEVARLVAAGLSNTEIAGRLFISPRTVTTHLQHVYARLGLSSRAALTRWLLERGFATEDT